MSNNLTSERNILLPDISKNKKIFQTRNENQIKNLNIHSNDIVKTLKRGKSNFYKFRNPNFTSHINKSITELKDRKSFVKNTSFIKKNTFLLKSENFPENSNKINEIDDSRKVRISNLLNNAKNFFNKLGNYLEENKPKEIPYLNANKIYKRLSTVKKKDLLFTKPIKNKESDINKLYGRMYSLKILNDDNKNNIPQKNSYMANKSISKNKTFEESEAINNNKEIKNLKNEKRYNEQIIQTFIEIIEKDENINSEVNIKNDCINKNNNDKNPKNNQEQYKFNSENKEIIPLVNDNKYRNDVKYFKNDAKIAEIREVYPSYPYNRIISYINSTRTKNKKYKNNNFYTDLKNNLVSDSRYYYEKFLRDIKLINNDFNYNYSNNYRSIKKEDNKIKNVFIQLKNKRSFNPEFL